VAFPSPSRLPSTLRGLRATLREMPLAVSVAVVLAIGNVIMALLPAGDQLALARAASTNIAHLAIDPVVVLPASAFVDFGNGFLWVPLTLILLGGLERKFGAGRALAVTFGAHVVATLLSEGILLLQIASRLAPRSAINILDVGPSYAILAALSACLVVGGWRLRVAAVVSAMIVIPGVVMDSNGMDVSAVGHLTSLILGALLAVAFRKAGGKARLAGPLLSPKPPVMRKPATV
jgi:hypothetical protein